MGVVPPRRARVRERPVPRALRRGPAAGHAAGGAGRRAGERRCGPRLAGAGRCLRRGLLARPHRVRGRGARGRDPRDGRGRARRGRRQRRHRARRRRRRPRQRPPGHPRSGRAGDRHGHLGGRRADGGLPRLDRRRRTKTEDAEPAPECLRGEVGPRFSLVVHEGGSVESLAACARSRAVAALYALADGAYVSYVLEAPDFVNDAFRELFPHGLPPGTPLVAAGGDGG